MLAVGCVVLGLLAPAARGATLLDDVARDRAVRTPVDDADMERARARARATLPDFLALAANPPPGATGFAVKVGLRETGTPVEFFWLVPFRKRGGGFVGIVSNRPNHLRLLREGQEVTFYKADISDWLWVDAAGAMHGNRTGCVLVNRGSEAEVAAMRESYGLDCRGPDHSSPG